MTTELVFYKCDITPSKNACVDSIESYLSDKIIRNLHHNYVKHDLDITLKVDLTNDQFFNPECNYIKITNNDERSFYYFIIKSRWISTEVIELTLSMDTINSFRDLIGNFSDKTKIIRQHRDRFVRNHYSRKNMTFVNRRVDKEDEGVNGLVQYQISNNALNFAEDNYYLIYTSDSSDGVACYLTASKGFTGAFSSSYTLTRSNLQQGKGYAILARDNGSITVTTNKGDFTANSSMGLQIEYAADGTFYLWRQNSTGSTSAREAVDYVTIPRTTYAVMVDLPAWSVGKGLHWWSMINSVPYNTTFTGSTQRTTIDPITKIDRTNSKIVRIIECPYAPVNKSSDYVYEGFYPEGVNLGISGSGVRLLRLTNLDQQFLRNLYSGYLLTEMTLRLPLYYSRFQARKMMSNESKLLNSNLYQIKFTYDSFGKVIPFENINCYICNKEAAAAPTLKIDYVQSSNFNSNLLFDFKTYDGNAEEISEIDVKTEDYPNILLCKRNNEIPIYNNDYITYLKNGYNYDVKAKDWSIASTYALGAIQIAGAVVSFGASAGTGGISAAAGIGLLTSGISTIAGAISNQVSQENAFNQKQEQLKNQAASINTADDLSLLKYYAKNKLHRIDYKVSNQVSNLMYELFNNYGYACSMYAIPDTASRRSFNYIQCEPVFEKNVESNPILINYLDDIKARYQTGVTYFHRIETDPGIYIWDFDKEYENWETWICPRIRD